LLNCRKNWQNKPERVSADTEAPCRQSFFTRNDDSVKTFPAQAGRARRIYIGALPEIRLRAVISGPLRKIKEKKEW
jgi:hypothetical protein